MRIFAGPVLPFSKKSAPIRFRMQKSDTGQSADLYLYDIIGDSWDGTTAKQFAADLKELGSPKTLNIFINSPGGSVFDGVAIYNILRRHAARKIVIIDGLAASIASIIAMAGDEIKIPKNGMMMIHDPWGFAIGTADEMRKAAESLDKIRATMIETYAERSGTATGMIGDWMAAETWFTGDEAVAAGFADVLTEEVAAAALGGHDLATFRNVPDSLRRTAEAMRAAAVVIADNTITNNVTVGTHETGTVPAPHPALARAAAHLRRRNLGPALN